MAEFGENIKRIREELGMTQQTLAEKLYVTRQAVSRWENGSRYPDLLTARKLSQALGTGLDDLLSDDDMSKLVKNNPVTEYPVDKRVTTAFFAVMLTVYSFRILWLAVNLHNFSLTMSTIEWLFLIPQVTMIFLTIVFGYSTVMSVKDRITPKIAGLISAVFFGTRMLERLFVHFDSISQKLYPDTKMMIYDVCVILFNLAAVIISIWYFTGDRTKNPIPVYILLCVYFVFEVIFMIRIIKLILFSDEMYILMSSITVAVADLLFPVLICYLAFILNRKRKRAFIT